MSADSCSLLVFQVVLSLVWVVAPYECTDCTQLKTQAGLSEDFWSSLSSFLLSGPLPCRLELLWHLWTPSSVLTETIFSTLGSFFLCCGFETPSVSWSNHRAYFLCFSSLRDHCLIPSVLFANLCFIYFVLVCFRQEGVSSPLLHLDQKW